MSDTVLVPKKRMNLTPLSIFRENRAGRTSSLKWGLNAGYPRITVFINGADRSINGRDNMIIVPFTHQSINTLFGNIEAIIDEPNDTTYRMDCYNNAWDNTTNKRKDEIELQSSITVGKDSNGIIYLMVSANGKPDVGFKLTIPEKYNRVYKNDEEITKTSITSQRFTKMYLGQLVHAFREFIKESTEVTDI